MEMFILRSDSRSTFNLIKVLCMGLGQEVMEVWLMQVPCTVESKVYSTRKLMC